MPETYELEGLNGREQDERMEPGDAAPTKARNDDGRIVSVSKRSPSEAALDRSVVRKLDFILLPFLSLFFLVNSLDRSNIGNAETANFTADAGLEPGDLNTATACFFAFFVALQPVGAACGRYFGMRFWVPSCMVIWGILTASHVWITSKWQLITIRIIIGMLEAGFYPVTVSYISLFYTRYEFARRLGIFYGQYAIAGALGGLLAYAVFTRFPSDNQEPQAWRPWQVLFLLEGSLTVVIALIGFFWLPDSADTAWFFNERERQLAGLRIPKERQQALIQIRTVSKESTEHRAEERLEAAEHEALLKDDLNRSDNQSKPMVRARGLSKVDVIAAFTDWKVFYLLIMNILSAIPAAAFTVFLPLIVQGFGFSSVTANLFTAPPFLLGAVVLWLFTWWSDRRQERFIPLLYGLAILLAGLTAVVTLSHEWFKLRYLALCVLLGGSFIASPLTIAWLTGNTDNPGKRAVVLGINGWGNLAGVFSSLLFAPRFAPDYQVPFFVTLSLVMTSFVGFMLFRKLLMVENARRKQMVDKWDAESVAAEADHGQGPYTTRRRHPWLSRVLFRMGIEFDETGRMGEHRLTYKYGL